MELDMKNDVVVGCITNYNFDQIRTWVNSLDQSGFSGDKVMICYNVHTTVADQLASRGYKVFAFEQNGSNLVYNKPNFNIVVDRFLHLWLFFKQMKDQYRYIITTDVRDVIFQRNPSEWLEANLKDKKINASSESILYKDEIWGTNNLFRAYGPDVHAAFNNNLIVNAGVMAGDFETMLDLFLNIYIMSNGASSHHIPGGGGPDQAAYNILLSLKTYRDVTNVSNSEDGWAAQLGTTGPQTTCGPIVESKPTLVDGVVCTSEGKPFTIVHQYDRVPQWNKIIESKYT
jgi:hypothetical protein